jgi:hypothetical protein
VLEKGIMQDMPGAACHGRKKEWGQAGNVKRAKESIAKVGIVEHFDKYLHHWIITQRIQ